MSDNLPGFSAGDSAKPPTARQMRREERDMKALRIYYRNGMNFSEVRKALNLSSNAEAQVVVNRALKAWRERNDEHVHGLMFMHDSILTEAVLKLARRGLGTQADGSDMDLAALDRLRHFLERQSKQQGMDATKESEGAKGDTIVIGPGADIDINLLPPGSEIIETRRPDQRGEIIEGEVVDDEGE